MSTPLWTSSTERARCQSDLSQSRGSQLGRRGDDSNRLNPASQGQGYYIPARASLFEICACHIPHAPADISRVLSTGLQSHSASEGFPR